MNKKNPRFDAILFDMDGVIIDTKEQVEAFWLEKMELYGVSVDEEYLERSLHGRPARFIIEELFPDLSEKERTEMDRECTEYDARQDSHKIIPGAESLLRQLTKSRVPIGLVTSALPPKVDVMLQSLSIENPFLTTITANLVKKGKPDPECYLLGAFKLNVDIKKVLVFEDSASGVRAAHTAGATVIGVNEPAHTEMLMEKGAIGVINNFTGAEFNMKRRELNLSEIELNFPFHSA
ncbi:MAG: HAD-IA family hydrolase [Balneolaceae bacterium]|nr:HAD-IA family hydrolase [Balneolaceae bacterium]